MKKILCTIIALMALGATFAQTPNYQGIVYVTPTGAGTHSGDSWANATASIADAQTLAQANNCVVWVAAGIYYGDTSSGVAFRMTENVNVYGGFAGNETSDYDLSLRDFVANETILDGDSARMVLSQPSNFSDTTMWDGFTIRNGYFVQGGGVTLRGKGMLNHCQIYNNTGTSGYGGVYAIDNHAIDNAIIANCEIHHNSAMFAAGIGAYNSTITNCEIHHNTAPDSYGAVLAYNSIIANCEIHHNSARYDAGITADRNSIISNCVIFDNVSTDGGAGGVSASNSDIANCEIYNNTPSGMSVGGSTASNCEIYNNNGSGVCTGGNTTVSNCVIHDNTGGGVYVSYGSATISNCQIYGNTAYSGGGVYASRVATISNCQIYDNHASLEGGGISNEDSYYSTISVSNCDIYNNTANCGGGVCTYNSFISDCIIHDNMSISSTGGNYSGGGGVFAKNSDISNCEIHNNTANYCGGGVYVCTNTVVSNCEIHNNNGGGVNADNSVISKCEVHHNTYNGPYSIGGGITANNSAISNSAIYNNTSPDGGGVIAECNNSTIKNSTIVCNNGGGVGRMIGHIHIANCIVCSNVRDDVWANVEIYCDCTYSAIEGEYEGEGNIDITGMQLFVNPSLASGATDSTENVDWHLLPNAICINKGISDSVNSNFDLGGVPRILCDTVDIGCYEYFSVIHEATDTICDSYIWYDSIFTESGNYFSTHSCDTLFQLHLTVRHSMHNVIDTAVCDSYEWHGESYTESGDYTWTGQTIHGCDSVVALHLTINESVEMEVSETAVGSYEWHGATYTESGDYTWTGQNAAGCDSVVTLHLTITTGITDNGLSSGFTLYPNPTTGFVTLRLSPETCNLTPEIHLFDIYGRRLQMMTVTGETIQINLSNYSTGIYIIKLVNGGRVFATGKVVKE